MSNVRFSALKTLMSIEKGNKYANIEIDSQIERQGFDRLDSAFFTMLVYGTLERKLTLDYLIEQYSDREIKKIDKEIHFILRMGIYQILFADKVPDHSAVDESVNLCNMFKKSSATSFVNALLRKVCRNKDTLPLPDRDADLLYFFSVRYSTEKWICEKFISAYGSEKTEKILRAYEKIPPVTLRVNTLKTSGEKLRTSCRDAVLAENGHALILPALPHACIKEGLAFVQDLSSQKCVALLDPRPGETILDACACPGGKSFAMAMLMKNEGEIISADLHKNKLSLIEKGADVMGIEIIQTIEMNSSVYREELDEKFDRVLCDVPCSGLGVIGKKPELRYKSEQDVARLPGVQYAILKNCASYVKKGGRLMYSTCTLNPDENEQAVKRFLTANPEFALEKEETLFPDEGEQDGFYMALMSRSE